MKIRFTGKEEEIDRFVEDMEQYYDIVFVSPFYLHDRKSKKSKIGAVYIEANLVYIDPYDHVKKI